MKIGQKIAVIGCPGSGKSTFSKKLSEISLLPLIHLDNIWWRADRTHISRDEFDEKLSALLKTDKWIIDGNYNRTIEVRLQACDTAIFLDYSLDECLSGIAERIGERRDDCPLTDTELDPELVKMVENYDTENRPRIVSLLEKYADRSIFIFKTRCEGDTWLEALKAAQ